MNHYDGDALVAEHGNSTSIDFRDSTLQGSKIVFIGRLPRRDRLPHDCHGAGRLGHDLRRHASEVSS